MALKHKLTQAEFDKLSDEFKKEYKKDGEEYLLDVEGAEDTGALKRAKDREVQLRKEAEQKAKELQDKIDASADIDARKKGDIETLEKSWQGKLTAQKAESDAAIAKLSGSLTKNLVENVALQLASKISTAPALILPHIRARLAADFEGDSPKTRVLDKDGKPSAMTVEELQAEFVANKDYAAIIIGSKASGSAGNPSNTGGAGKSAFSGKDAPDLASMSPADLAAQITASKGS